jgi:HSP20 family protein
MSNLKLRKPFVPGLYNMRDEFVTPFSQLFDDIFEKTFPEFRADTGIQFSKGSFPKVDIVDYQDSIEIIAEIPGWKKEDLAIKCESGILTLSGKTQDSVEDASKNYILKELKRSSFQRSFQLTDKLNENDIRAHFENGILKILVGKKETNSPNPTRTIEIK